ncbi:unnamed protein product [Closterium sp. Naga37s-1]|nr:unnamed protein product [Closterium sp. Naga37s-1]
MTPVALVRCRGSGGVLTASTASRYSCSHLPCWKARSRALIWGQFGRRGESVPVAAPSAPSAAPVPPAQFVDPPVSAPTGVVADPPVPVPGAPVVPSASAPAEPSSASASSPKAASATTGVPAPSVLPAVAGPSVPTVTPVAPAGQPSRPQSPNRRLSRPHSPAPHQKRRSTRLRRDSPRRYQQQTHWPAHPGGQGDWRGPRGRGGGGGYRPPVTMADLQREVSRAVREERAAQSESSSMRASPALPCAPRPPLRLLDRLCSPWVRSLPVHPRLRITSRRFLLPPPRPLPPVLVFICRRFCLLREWSLLLRAVARRRSILTTLLRMSHFCS